MAYLKKDLVGTYNAGNFRVAVAAGCRFIHSTVRIMNGYSRIYPSHSSLRLGRCDNRQNTTSAFDPVPGNLT